MMGRRRAYLLAGIVGLCGALFANTAVAALLLQDSWAGPTFGAILLETFAEEMLSTPETPPDEASPGPSPSDPPAEGEYPAIVSYAEGLTPGGAAGSNSSSQSTGGSTGEALAAAARYLPELDLQGSLPSEAMPNLPSGPPFKLLRPV